MKKGLVIADAGAIFSLAFIDELELLNQIFDNVKISKAVWEEITLDKSTEIYKRIEQFFKTKVINIVGSNDLTFIMDYGESESVILYRELNANFLLIDDKKARKLAENFGVNCIGTLGVLSVAKTLGIIENLKPIFQIFLSHDRYYSLKLLNFLLEKHDETKLLM